MATYGTFVVYPADLDGDGVQEIMLESGYGRGTDVHVRALSVYKIMKNRFVELLSIALNGYFMREESEGSLIACWERSYFLRRSRTGQGLDIVVDWIPPSELSSEDLDRLAGIEMHRAVGQYDGVSGHIEMRRE